MGKQDVWEDNHYQGYWALSAWKEENQSQERLFYDKRRTINSQVATSATFRKASFMHSIRVRRVIESESE